MRRPTTVSETAQLLLKEIGRETLLEYFSKRLQSGKDLISRPLLVMAFGQLAGTESKPILSQIASDIKESPTVRVAAIKGYGGIVKQLSSTADQSESTRFLIGLLNDDLSEVRSAAAIQLVELQSLDSISLLRDLNEDNKLDYLAREEVQKFLASVVSPFDGLLPPLRERSVVGRNNELQALFNAFKNSQTVNLVGIGGIGKTTLANQFVYQSNYDVKVWRSCRNSFDLAFLATDILKTLADTLGTTHKDLIKEHSGDPRFKIEEAETKIIQLLRDRSTLIVLDDYETLRETDAVDDFIRRLVTHLPQLNCLIVGRSASKALSESVIRLQGLSYEASIDLLRETSLNKQIELDAENEQKLIRLAEGNPLFLNWFASQISLGLPIDENAISQDAISTIIGKSLNTLDLSDRRALEIFSQFDEPIVYDDPEVNEILVQEQIGSLSHALQQLNRMSFVDITSEKKLTIHSLIREYIRHQTDRRLTLRINSALAKYYQKRKNYLQAATHFVRAEMSTEAVFLISEHSTDIVNQGHVSTALGFLQSEIIQNELDVKAKMLFLATIGDFSLFAGRYEHAFKAYEQASNISQDISDNSSYLSLINKMGQVRVQLGEYAEAKRYFSEALQIAQREDNFTTYVSLVINLGNLYTNLGDFEQAEVNYQEGLRVSRQLGNARQVSMLLMSLGSIKEIRGEFSNAEAILRESLELAKQIDDKQIIIKILGTLGNLAVKSGKVIVASEYLQEGLLLSKILSDKVNTADLLLKLGDLSLVSNDFISAMNLTSEALSVAKEIGYPALVIVSLNQLGTIKLQEKKPFEARKIFQEAVRLAEELEHQEMMAESYFGLSRASVDLRLYPEALEQARKSLKIFESLGHYRSQDVREWIKRIPTTSGK
ncbi:MAG TPA: tetratricopeptide repeat protein [Anaerolineales bacterium]|uniref:tetratricopeptide repeat protein n=1 Tax=Candidatus Brocadia sp. AMX2 TaxID=2293635 RepID=UPI0017AC128F|nr:tetratricopeptide repeat protein [Candidatus Brocadia sp. AMX2]MBC6934151.1 hypothetical protein [Candidatus Brocadia sp.]MBL1170844.1 hypothetical protein [Chloroflexota bacterium]WKZ55541.1 MAG: tetratricopeptide repeat protein [Anaerolineales bacterium]MDL1937381.1 tetratricopeptide repeat protein [Candidatus Brocadia sp. AMX2]NOG74292.1 tetratricopeptide repeat protein [Chloroflexota bacterium]